MMTRALPFTQASLRRAIEAARKAGLQVTGIRADGTLLVGAAVDGGDERLVSLAPEGQPMAPSKWADVET
jgi:hypothetical protein